MTFHPDGTLTYVARESGKDRVILLSWRTEGQTIITDQPTMPHEERTQYGFTPDGRLILKRGHLVTRYARIE